MKTSSTGITLIQAFESCLKPLGGGQYTTYFCPAHVLTIGWGTTKSDYPSLKHGDVWGKAKCDEVFASSLGSYEAAVDRLLSGRSKPIAQHQYDALTSITYNCGEGVLAGSIGRAVREGRDADVPDLMARWNKGGGKVLPGLVRRRAAEGALYAGDVARASAKAQTVLPGAVSRTREVPVPSAAELSAATKGSLSTAAAGAVVASVGAAQPSAVGGEEARAVLVGVGLALAVVAAVVLVTRWTKLKETWA